MPDNMSNPPTPPQDAPIEPSPDPARQALIARREADYLVFKHYAAIAGLIVSPILLAVPPRRLNSMAVIQATAFGMSANYLIRERTGQSILGNISTKFAEGTAEHPTERYQAIQAQLRAERDARINEGSLPTEELEKLRARQRQDRGGGALDRLWMGGESDDWKRKRLEEEQKALAEGKGYGDLIKGHFADAFGWGGKENKDEGEKKDPKE